MTVTTEKPPYAVPTLASIHASPTNGLVVASTFSGGGGSCLGYRIAGFEVKWANEFVPAARDTYRANHPATVLDDRDIREVQPDEVLDALGLVKGELDLFDGSPPCQSFSTAGKREKGWGQVSDHADGSRQRSDDLFFEYARLLDGLQPRAFIAENVAGLGRGMARGYFKEIHAALVACGYRVEARLVDAQWCGVPQRRLRLIFQGVREDLGLAPAWPQPLPYLFTVRDALSDLGEGLMVRSPDRKISGRQGETLTDRPMPAVTTLGLGNGFRVTVEPEAWLRGKAADVAGRLRPGQSGDDVEGGSYWSMERLHPDRPAGTVQASEGAMPSTNQVHPTQARRLSIAELRRICSFPDDYALTGSYAEQWARLGNSVPPLMMARIAAAVRDGVLSPG